MGDWFGWSGGSGAWGARGAADAGEELGKGQADAGRAGGQAGPEGGIEGTGGGGATGGGGGGRRGAHLEVGEVASEVAGSGQMAGIGLEGQLLGGGGLAGRVQSSMNMGFTNHRRSFPMDSSISQEQFA
jgi:hypothetical protein